MVNYTVTGNKAYFNQGGRFFDDVYLHKITNREDAPYRKQLFIDDYGKIYADFGALFVWDNEVRVGVVSTVDFGYNLDVSKNVSGIVTVTSYTTVWDERNFVGFVTTVDYGYNIFVSEESSGIVTVTSYTTVWDDRNFVGFVTTVDYGYNIFVSEESSGIVTITSYSTIWDNRNPVGLVTTIDYGYNLSVSEVSSGIATVTSYTTVWDDRNLVGFVTTVDYGYNLSVSEESSGIVTITSYSTIWDNRNLVGIVTTIDFGTNVFVSPVSSGIVTISVTDMTPYTTVWDDDVVVGIITTVDYGYNLVVSENVSGIVTVTSYSTVLNDGNIVGLVTSIDFGENIFVSPISSGIVTVSVSATEFTPYTTIWDNGEKVGIITTIDFGDNLDVSEIVSGILTVTGRGGGSGDGYWVGNFAGIHTFSNVSIGTSIPTTNFNVLGDSFFEGNVNVSGITSSFKFFGSGIYVPTMYIGETPPSTALPGNLWYDSNEGRTFLYYEDQDSSQWVDLSPPESNSILTISDTAPSSPLVGNLWYNTTNGRSFVYYSDGNSSQWVDFSPDGTTFIPTFWSRNVLGIHTDFNVGFGTDYPTSPITISGVIEFTDGNITIGDPQTALNRTTLSGNNIFLGSRAAYCHTDGNNTIAIGKESGYWNRGENNIYIGECSGRSSTRNLGEFFVGSYNLAIGKLSGANNTSGEDNIFVGRCSGFLNDTGTSNIFLGKYTGCYNQFGSFNNFIGECAGASAGPNGSCNNFFGYKAGYYNYDADNNNFFGAYTGFENCGSSNIFIGKRAGQNNKPGSCNIFFGHCTGFFNQAGESNTFIGEQSGYSNDSGSRNIFVGKKAGYANTTGFRNIFIGECTGYNSLISYDNNFFGNISGYNIREGYRNTFIGQSAGFYNTDGHNNAYFGNYTGKSELASYKVLLGQGTAPPTFSPPYIDYRYFDGYFPEDDKQLAIGINTTGQSEYWIVGDKSMNIGIGTAIPSRRLDVVGDARITGVLTAAKFVGDGSGLVNIPNIVASRWAEAAQGQSVGIWTSGNVGIGTIDPTSKLTIRGDVRVIGSGIVTANRFDANIVNASVFSGAFFGDGSGITNLSMAGQWDYNNTGIHTLFNVGIGTTTSSNKLTLLGLQEFVGTNVKIGVSSAVSPLYTATPEEKFNTFIGYRPGYNNSSGCANNYIGYYAGTSSSGATGSWNNFMGAWAGRNNFSGSSNNFFGYEAGRANTSGGYNNFFGECAGKCNTTGSYNIFFGRFTGAYNTTGSWNTFFGCSTGRCNLTGNENVFIGRNAGLFSVGSYNNFFGSFAGCSQRGGSYNVAIGYSAQLLDEYGSHQLTIGAGNSSWIVGTNEFFVGIGSTTPISKFTVYGDAHFSGIATFAKLYGDGSGLYNITATVSPGINIRNNGNFVGVAATLNFDGFFDASPVSAGVVTVSINDSISSLFIWEKTSVGVNTLSRVGLGSTSPRQQLDVRGNAIISGITTADTFSATNLIVSPSATLNNLTGIVANIVSISGNNIDYTGIGTIRTLSGNVLNYQVGVINSFSSSISTITNLVVNNSLTATGLARFVTGPIIVGTAASTGTPNQVLQINGNSYISGRLGIGTTNPIEEVQVIGDAVISGFVSAAQFIGDGSGLTGVVASNADSLWVVTSVGIHTLRKVGIGTTNPTSQLTVGGSIGFSDDSIRIGNEETGACLVKNIGILNTFVGFGAAACVTTGAYNSFFGAFSGRFNTTGCYNSFFGTNSGQCNTTGDSNSFFGFLAGRNTTTGFRNSFFGRSSGLCNTTGRINSFFGFYSGINNLSGCNNSFFGSFIGCSQNSSYKILIGSGQGSAYFDFPVAERSKTLAIGINSLGFNEYWLVGNERLNVGIGTTNPTSRLSVGGDVDIAGVVTSRRLATGNISGAQITGTQLSITGNGSFTGVVTAGVVTATTFYGDGSKLTGIIAEGAGVVVRDDDIPFGTASIINFGENISLSPIISGITTVTVENYWSDGGTGIITTGSIGIGTTSASSTLTVFGDAFITGVVTASRFFGDVGYARTAGIATVATNVIGGIANVVSLNVSGITTLGQTSISNITNVGVITAGIVSATTFFGDGSKLSGITAGIASISEYSKASGIATIAGIATSVIGGIASLTQLNVIGISTLGIVTAIKYYGDGSELTGIERPQWVTTSAGIHTLSNVGVGTTNPTSRLTVRGDGLFTGIVTANKFVGDGSGLTGLTAESAVVVWDSGVQVGTATSLDFGENLSVTFNSGYATINSATGISTQWITNPSGIHTFSNLGVGTATPSAKLYVSGNAIITGILTVGILSATTLYGDGSQLTGISAGISSVADYAKVSGIATYATTAGVSTYASVSGIATYATRAGVSTYASVSGVSTYAQVAGVSTSVNGGTATVTQLNVSGVSNLNVVQAFGINVSGAVTATSFTGDGSRLTGIIADASKQWVTTAAGIHTLANVGIGTTIPRSKLYVTGDLYVTGIITSTDYDSLSDKKLKTNIETFKNPIETINQIRGVTFDWKNTSRPSAGVVAQEIEKVLPQLVHGEDTKTVNYNGLIGLLIECVKEQQKEIDELKKKIL